MKPVHTPSMNKIVSGLRSILCASRGHHEKLESSCLNSNQGRKEYLPPHFLMRLSIEVYKERWLEVDRERKYGIFSTSELRTYGRELVEVHAGGITTSWSQILHLHVPFITK